MAAPSTEEAPEASDGYATEEPAAAPEAMKGELFVLLLLNGMTAEDLGAGIERMKQSSKSIGTHKRRELFWDAYTQLNTAAVGLGDGAQTFLQYRAEVDSDGNFQDGHVQVIRLTNRQRGSLGSIDFMGFKLKGEDPKSKPWCLVFSEDDAQMAWDDLMTGEPCIYITADGIYVATRCKRVLCKGLSGMPKTLKDVEQIVSDLAPDKPLRSVSFAGHHPPSLNAYNVFLAGVIDKSLGPALSPTIGHINTTSATEIYDYFLQRRNESLLGDAAKLLAQMVADVGKQLTPLIIAGSTKEISKAYKNALIKKVFVHESSTKFISLCRRDNQCELVVITGDVEKTEFGKYGKLVAELFYRADLATM